MKKLLAVSFACVLVAAGCSNGEDEQTDSTVNEEQEQQETNENEEQNEKSDQQETEDEDQESDDEGKNDEGQKEDGKNEGKDTQKSDEDENQLSLTKDKAKQVAVQAKTSFDEIINSTEGNSSKMKGYGTKEDVVNELKDVMSQSLAQGLTDAYFAERDGALYLQPQGGPLWFNQDGSFKLKHPSEKEYVIVQEQSSELSGNVTMHYIIKYDGENWVLDQMKSQQKQQNSQSKVTQEQAVELVREHIGTQGENVKVEFDHMDGERYVVHVYEVVEQENNTHTATKGWYYVDPNTGEVTNMMH